MDIVDREVLLSLAQPAGWPSVSAYLPTHRLPFETDADRIRFKNQIRRAEEDLADHGMARASAEKFCQPLHAVLDDPEFWKYAGEGLAVFLSPSGIRTLRLHERVPESLTVADRFYLRPLASAYRPPVRFYALALDKNGSRLFEATRYDIKQVPVGDTPLTFEEAMKYEDAERNLTHATYAPGRPASRGNQHGGSTYAGYGGEKEVAVEQLVRFARFVERRVSDALAGDKAPLFLLGVDRLLSAYRQVNTYEGLLDEHLTGATDYFTRQRIHESAMEALAPRLESGVSAELQELEAAAGSNLGSRDVAEILPAAAAGRVKTLFVDDGSGPFGNFDRDSFEVEKVCQADVRFLRDAGDAAPYDSDACGWDLVDLAIAETALHGGDIRSFSGESSPVQGAAALFRY